MEIRVRKYSWMVPLAAAALAFVWSSWALVVRNNHGPTIPNGAAHKDVLADRSVKGKPAELLDSLKPRRRDRFGDQLPVLAIGRLGTTRLNMVDTNVPSSLSADGKLLVTRNFDSTISLWDTRTAEELRRFGDQQMPSYCVAMTSTGDVWAGGDKCIRRWNCQTGKVARKLECPGYVYQLALSHSAQLLAAACLDPDRFGVIPRWPVIRVWDIHTGKLLYTLVGHENPINCLAFSRDEKILASGDGHPKGSVEATIRLWDMRTGAEADTWSTPGISCAISLSFSTDGQTLACGGSKRCQLWDVATASQILERRETGDGVAFSPREDVIAVGTTTESAIQLLDFTTNKVVRAFAKRGQKVSHLVFSPNGDVLIAAGGGSIARWNVVSGKEIGPLPGHRSAI